MLCGELSDGPKKCECITFTGKSVTVEGRFQALLYGEAAYPGALVLGGVVQ